MSDVLPVSVIIPCYRSSSTLLRAFDSIISQTRKPYEVILIDDASDDDTPQLIRSIVDRYGGWVVSVFLENNSGAAHARNVGWDIATQPLIAFLDSDDIWHDKKLEVQYEWMCHHQDFLLCGHASTIINQQPNKSARSNEGFSVIGKYKLLLSNQFVTPSIMLKKDIPYRFSRNSRYMEDHLLWMEILLDGNRVAKLDASLVTIGKFSFGVSGLSSHLFRMELAEIKNYFYLYKKSRINLFLLLLILPYSLLKFIRRIFISILKLHH